MNDQRGEATWASSIAKRVGERLAEVRRARGMSAQQLADAMAANGHELNRASISKLELGHRGISLPDLIALAWALDVSPIHLLFDPHEDESFDFYATGVASHQLHFAEWWSGEHYPTLGPVDRHGRWRDASRVLTAYRKWVEARERVMELTVELADLLDVTNEIEPTLKARLARALEHSIRGARLQEDELALQVPWIRQQIEVDAYAEFRATADPGDGDGDGDGERREEA